MLGQSVNARACLAGLGLAPAVLSADSAAVLDGEEISLTVDLSADRADVPTLAPPKVVNETTRIVEMVVAVADHPMRYGGRWENVSASVLADDNYLKSFEGVPVLLGNDHPRDDRGRLRRFQHSADASSKIGTVLRSWFDPVENVQKARVTIDTPQGLQAIRSIRGVSPMYLKRIKPVSGTASNGQRFDVEQDWRGDGDHVLVTPNARGGVRTHLRSADTGDPQMDPMKLAALLRKAGLEIEADADMKEAGFAKLVADAFGAAMKGKDEESADAVGLVQAKLDELTTAHQALEADAKIDRTMEHYRAAREVEASADALGVKVDLTKATSLDEARRTVLAAALGDRAPADLTERSGDALEIPLNGLVELRKLSADAKPEPKPRVDPLAAIRAGTRQTPASTPSADSKPHAASGVFSAGA